MEQNNEYLILPPPDRVIMMQSPPPLHSVQPPSEEEEDAPSRSGPIDFMPEVVGTEGGRIVYKPKYFKAPIIVIEGTN